MASRMVDVARSGRILHATCRLAILAAVTTCVVSVVPVCRADEPASAAKDTENKSSKVDKAAEAARLIDKLGDEQFVVREQATQQLLRLGLDANQALEGGTRHLDREVRYRCERILIQVRQLDFERRLEAFLNESGSGKPHDFPGWTPYQKEFGDTLDSRKLFVEMQRSEAGLLAALDKGPQSAIDAIAQRVQELQQAQQTQSQQVSLGSVTTLLFVATQARAETNQQVAQNVYSFCYQQSFRNGITSGANKELLRKLLGIWIRRGEDWLAYQGIMLSMQYDLKDGLVPAEKLLRSPNSQPHMRQYAIVMLAKMGDENQVQLIETMLTDNKSIGTWQVNNVNISTQVRDVALAALIHVTKQDYKEYGFDRIQMTQPYLFNPITAGFENDEKRNKAMEKWKAYRASQKKEKP